MLLRLLSGDVEFGAQFCRHRVRVARRLLDQEFEQCRHLLQLDKMIWLQPLQGILRHLRESGAAGILHHGDAATLPELPQAGRAVAECPGQDHTDAAVAAADRGRAQHHIDRRAGVVFARAGAELDLIALDHQMPVRRRDIDVPFVQGRTGRGEARFERSSAAQKFVKHGARTARQVNGHAHCGGEIRWKPPRQIHQGVDAAGRGADGDNIAVGHETSFPRPPFSEWPVCQ